MNIQVFIDRNEQKLFSIDMEKVEAITETEACLAVNGKNGYIPDITDIRPLGTCGNGDLMLPATAFAIDCMLQTNTNSYHAVVIFTVNELWDLLERQNEVGEGVELSERQKTSHLGDSFTDEDALRIMIRYWRDIQDTPLTKATSHREQRQPLESCQENASSQAGSPVCKKLLVGLYKGDNTLIFEEIVYPGFMDALDFDDMTRLNETIDFAAVDDPDHPDLIVTDDIVCLAERMCEEWGKGHGLVRKTCDAETCVAKVLDNMVEGVIKADRIRIDGNMFNADDGQYIVAERYTKDIKYTEKTKKFMEQIGKELKK